MSQEMFKAAAKWWADKMRKPVIHDNGDAFQSMLSTTLASHSRHKFGEAEIEKFEDYLARTLEHAFPLRNYYISIGVDYAPERFLSEALKHAGINSDMCLPIKSMMWIEKESVRAACGYRAPIEDVFIIED